MLFYLGPHELAVVVGVALVVFVGPLVAGACVVAWRRLRAWWRGTPPPG